MTDSEYLLSLLDETFAAVPQIKAHHERMRQIAARLATHPLAAAVLQQEAGEPVGVAGAMPGTSGFTMACFKAADVPVGTKLYATPPLPQRQEAAQVEADDFVGKRLRLVCKLAGVPIPDGDDKQIADCAFVLLGMIRAALERANAALGAAVGLTIAEIADPKHGSPASLATPPASSRVAAPTMQAVKVPLTDEQIQDAWAASSDPDCAEISIFDFATAIQRACAEAWGIQLSEGERSHD